MQSIKWPGCAAQIHVQCQGVSISNCLVTDILQPVENLKATFSTTHIKFQWKGPPVLSGIKLFYNIHLFRDSTIVFNETVTQTFFAVPFICPCQPSCFGVIPVADKLLVGEERSLGPNCTNGLCSICQAGFYRLSIQIIILKSLSIKKDLLRMFLK